MGGSGALLWDTLYKICLICLLVETLLRGLLVMMTHPRGCVVAPAPVCQDAAVSWPSASPPSSPAPASVAAHGMRAAFSTLQEHKQTLYHLIIIAVQTVNYCCKSMFLQQCCHRRDHSFKKQYHLHLHQLCKRDDNWEFY